MADVLSEVIAAITIVGVGATIANADVTPHVGAVTVIGVDTLNGLAAVIAAIVINPISVITLFFAIHNPVTTGVGWFWFASTVETTVLADDTAAAGFSLVASSTDAIIPATAVFDDLAITTAVNVNLVVPTHNTLLINVKASVGVGTGLRWWCC